MPNFQGKGLLLVVIGVVLFFGLIVIIATCMETGIKCYDADFRRFNSFKGYDRCYWFNEDWKARLLLGIGCLGIIALIGGGLALMCYLKREKETYTTGLFQYSIKGQEVKNALARHA